VANSLFRRRTLVLLALVVISVIAGKCGHPGLGQSGVGFWDGPR
jgi:ABC-type methionine transport system permease subunit